MSKLQHLLVLMWRKITIRCNELFFFSLLSMIYCSVNYLPILTTTPHFSLSFFIYLESNLSQLKLQGEKTGRKGHLSVATEVRILQTPPPPFFFNPLLFSLPLPVTHPIPLLEVARSWAVYNSLFQIFEVAPSLYMVEVRKSGGDTLEFHKVYYNNVIALCGIY